METIIVYTDGGARGNPGPAGIGIYITDSEGKVLKEVSESLGNGTNNFAEYQAVMVALQTLKQMYGKETKEMRFDVRLDSELVTKQLNSEYQIKEPGLVPQFIEIHNMRVASFPNVSFTHVPREKNTEADRLANEAMDRAGQRGLGI
jgi:ribonuclease HI